MAMRHHFAALERLVAMGLSPQAARAALRNMDEWLTSKAGIAQMAQAEASARESGEPILHTGDHVCLHGLVKNAAANGKMAVLQTYVAENQRWKVCLTDGKAYLLQPKFLQPVARKPTVHLKQLEEANLPAENCATSNGNEAPFAATQAAEHERAKEDAARQQLVDDMKIQQEEIRLQQEEMRIEQEEQQRTKELLSAERVELRRSRASLAMVQAHVASMLEKTEAGGEPKTHRLDDNDAAEEWNTNEAEDDHSGSEPSEDPQSDVLAQENLRLDCHSGRSLSGPIHPHTKPADRTRHTLCVQTNGLRLLRRGLYREGQKY